MRETSTAIGPSMSIPNSRRSVELGHKGHVVTRARFTLSMLFPVCVSWSSSICAPRLRVYVKLGTFECFSARVTSRTSTIRTRHTMTLTIKADAGRDSRPITRPSEALVKWSLAQMFHVQLGIVKQCTTKIQAVREGAPLQMVHRT